MTLRYPYEIRAQSDYFDDIPSEKIPKDMLELASHIVATKTGHFDPKKFDDRYEDALRQLIKRKQSGEPIERPQRPEPTNVVSLMDALRRSVEAERPSERRASRRGGATKRAPAKRAASHHGRRKAG